MAFKMKGPSLYGSPMKQVKTSNFGPRAAKGDDDQSRELAKSRYEMGEYKVDPTKPNTNEYDDKALDIKEDAEGKGKGSNRKVMKDGAVNKTQAAKIAKNKADFAKKTPAEKKALQDAANDKADKFHKRGKYAPKPKKGEDQYKDVKFAGDDGMDKN